MKKEKEKEPEKEPAPALMRKKGFEEEKKDSDDSDDVSIHLSSTFSPFLSLDEKILLKQECLYAASSQFSTLMP